MNNSIYINIDEIFSYNCLFNFVVGNRGAGKTYGAKNRAIKNFLKDGSQFIYVRRYDTEIKKARKSFFSDISAAWEDHTFQTNGDSFLIDGKEAGFSVTLSKAKILKSVSYPKVNLIIFDEFIIEKGTYRYLPNEVESFLDLYETIARTRDVIVLFLSNAVTFTNPYFLYFDIKFPKNKKQVYRKGEILLKLYKNEDFIEMKKKTRFGSIISDTSYGDYAIDNKFLLDNNTFIAKKTENAKYFFTFIYKSNEYGVWVDYKEGKMFISNDTDPSCLLKFSLTMQDHSPNLMMARGIRKHTYMGKFVEAYENGYCYFESIKIKNICCEVLKMTLL